MSRGTKDPLAWLERQAYTSGKLADGRLFLHVATQDGHEIRVEGTDFAELARVARSAFNLRRIP